MAINTHVLAGSNLADKPQLLLIDDDHLIIESLGFVLQESFDVLTASTREEAKSLLQNLSSLPSLALVDLGLPPTPHTPEEGFSLINELLAFNPAIKILVLSGQSKRSNIQHAMTLGAVDFVPKPCDVHLLKTRLQHQLMLLDAEKENTITKKEDLGIIGQSPAVETLRALIKQFADTPFPVLIEGESGSGKELVVEYLHNQSERSKHPLLTINCAAFPADLLEAQLFGHAKGAFTGADSAKAGFFEQADKGTLLLDEIGELPIELQAKLLRVLENGEYYRIGETQSRHSGARIVAATNRDLPEAVRKGVFRQDLYHRLSVLTIKVPPLRERGDDCLLLLDYFQQLYASTFPAFKLEKDAEHRLLQYAFPGNVRELRNIVIRLGSKHPGSVVNLRQLEAEMELAVYVPESDQNDLDQLGERELLDSDTFRLDEKLDEWEKRFITIALKNSHGNLSRAARILGINRTTLYSKIQRLSIEVEQQN
ncbi:MAG: sigma-54-dependent transcriptional regulator [Gammaproteobacteria bacterium]